jgi:hypothetical protein
MPTMNNIARLPRHIRNELGQRLKQGDHAQSILDWLNQPQGIWETQDRPPGARPLTHADLAEWRQNGYPQWFADQEACEFVRNLIEQAEALDAAAGDESISDGLATVLATDVARSATALLADASSPAERWQRLREPLHELARLRKGDHQSIRVQIEGRRWDHEHRRLEEEEHEREMQKEKSKATAPFEALLRKDTLAKLYGGGEHGKQIADYLAAVEYGLPVPELPEPGNPTESD